MTIDNQEKEKNSSEDLHEVIADVKHALEYAMALGYEEVPETVSEQHAKIPQKPQPAPAIENKDAPAQVTAIVKSSKDPEEQLLALREEIGDCTRCKLCKGRNTIVFGVGNPQADLMFIGEGPGRDEDLQGIPFVGQAGKLLTKIIEAMGYKRDDVYIANVVKCRPPNNRNPEPDEVATCKPFLIKQAEIIRPKVIVCLGSVATQNLLDITVPISRLRGTFTEWNGIPVMPTYHPAFLLRNANMKRPVWEDMQKVMQRLKEQAP